MNSNCTVLHIAKTGQESQVIERKAKRVKCHVVPATIPTGIRSMILSELRGGRSVAQVAKAYSTAADVVLELYVRDIERRLLGRMAA